MFLMDNKVAEHLTRAFSIFLNKPNFVNTSRHQAYLVFQPAP